MPAATHTITAADGHRFTAHVAEPAGTPRGAIVVVQEIFGLNAHIRAVADGYAAAGYLAVAPALFDRLRPGIELGYKPEDQKAGREYKAALEALAPADGPGALAPALLDLQAAVQHAARAGRVGIVGYCYGGLLAWRAAAQLQGLSAAVAYYGGGMTVAPAIDLQPRVPVLAHFATHDQHISQASVAAFASRHPEVEVHYYDADHGFNCDQRPSWKPEAAGTARERSLDFFARHMG